MHFASREILFETENLPAIAQRVAGEKAQFRQGIDDDTGRLQPLDLCQHRAGGVRKFDFRRAEDRVLGFRLELLFVHHEFEQINPIKYPPVRIGYLEQFRFRFGKRDVQALLALSYTFHQKLHGDGGFTRAWIAFNQIKVVARQAAAQNFVKTGNPHGEQLDGPGTPVFPTPRAVAARQCTDVLLRCYIHSKPQLRMRPTFCLWIFEQ